MNMERYKKDLDKLISDGGSLLNAMQFECYPEEFETQARKVLKGKKLLNLRKNFHRLKKNIKYGIPKP